MSDGISRDEWLKALSEAGLPMENDESALTLLEFAELCNIPRTTAQGYLAKLVKAGKASPTWKMKATSSGAMIRHRAYRLVQ